MSEGPAKVLVIVCGVCGSRFRFDTMLFRAASGAQVRCRRCGGSIEVANPNFDMRQTAQDPPPDCESGEAAGSARTGGDTGVRLPAGEPEATGNSVPTLPAFLRQREDDLIGIFRAEGPPKEHRRSPGRQKGSLVPFLVIAAGLLILAILGLWFLASSK